MIVSVDVLFSHNNMIGSKIIACGTSYLAPHCPKTSHVAILVNKRWVHESTGHAGVSVLSYERWAEVHTEVARIPIQSMEYQTIADQFRSIIGKKYDYLGVIYLGICIFANLLFKRPIPDKNRWENPKKYFCCEVLGYLVGQDYDMSAPVQILSNMRNQ